MKMITDQKHSSDSTRDLEKDYQNIRRTEKLAWLLGLDKQNAEVYDVLSGRNRTLEKELDDYYSQHKKLKKSVNQLKERVKWLDGDIDELFAIEHCNCNKESINSSFKSSSSEETITIVKGCKEFDSDYTPCKALIGPEKKIHKVNPGKVKCVKKKSGNKEVKPKRNL